jgi:virginiamycin B lyase
MNARAIAAGLTIAMLAGCAGGGSGTALPPSSPSNAVPSAKHAAATKKRHRVKGYAHILIRRPKHRRHLRDPRFISPATLGAEFVVKSDVNGTVTTDADLSPSSPYCTTSGPNTSSCTVPVPMPFGNDTITITTYAQAPGNNGFDPAKALAVGSQTQTVTDGGATPTINVFLSGIVDSIDAGPSFGSLPADGTASDEAFVVNGRDFGNVKIKAGTNDPYSNPITVRLTENGGGASHSTLQLNGSASGARATLTQSNDSVQLNYDGGGKPGYTATVTFSASGAPSQTIEVSPLYITATQIRSHVLNLNGSGVPARTMAITETDAPAGTTYTVTQPGCSGIAAASAVSGTGASATFTAQGGLTPSSNGCVISVADSNTPTAPYLLPATNTPINGNVNINGVQLTDYGSTGTTSEITIGPDGNLYIIEPQTNVLVVTPNGPSTPPTIQNTLHVPSASSGSPPPDSNLQGITTGPDGALWLTDTANGGVDRVDVSNDSITNYAANEGPTGITSSSDGSMWIGSAQAETLVNLSVGGAFTTISPEPSNNPQRVIQGADGAIWFTEGNQIGRYDPVGNSLVEIPVPSGGTAADLCSTSNGDVWFTANSTASNVYQITGPSHTVNTFSVATPASLTGIACGADNAVWYLDTLNNDVGRISLASGNNQTTYAIPDASFSPQFITSGPDGTLWYSSAGLNMFGRIIP